ncbi:hypothetical protein Ddc_19680 [Ditylenchus destructor]|nr:hypothetical protein Ddc_19680 [Ditylenchus destructor]
MAVSREVLAATAHAGQREALHQALRQQADHARIRMEAARADHRAARLPGLVLMVQVQHRRESEIDAAGAQLQRQHQAGRGGRLHGAHRVLHPQLAERAHRRQRGEAVGAEALHATAPPGPPRSADRAGSPWPRRTARITGACRDSVMSLSVNQWKGRRAGDAAAGPGAQSRVSTTTKAVAPLASNHSASAPCNRISGLPLGALTTSQDRQVIGMRMPMPTALEKASLAEKRVPDTRCRRLDLVVARLEHRHLMRSEHLLGEAHTAPCEGLPDAPDVADVGADAVDHRDPFGRAAGQA